VGEGGVWREEGSQGVVSALALVLLDGDVRESKSWFARHFLISNGAHRTENQPLRCWTR